MDNVTPKLAATFGVGFMGFILAAYSYNKYHKPEYTEELIMKADTDTEKDDSKNTTEPEKKEITEVIKSHWNEFWQKEFLDLKYNKKEVKTNDTN